MNSEKAKILKVIFICMIVVGIVGFILSTEMKQLYLVDSKEGTQGKSTVTFDLNGNEEYTLAFWAVDEEMSYEWADLNCDVLIELDGKLLQEKSVVASENSDEGGVKRAQNGFEYTITPESPGTLTIKVNLIEGDQWTLEIYRNIPDYINMLPALFIILAIVGVIGFLKARNTQV